MYDEKRLRASEQQGLIRLHVAAYALDDAEEMIGRRVYGIKRGKARLHMAKAVVRSLCKDAFDTVPEEQRGTVARNVDNTVYQVGVVRKGDKNLDEFGTWVSWTQLAQLIESAKCQCTTCENPGNRPCELRRVLDQLPNDADRLPAKNGCPYFVM